MDGTLYPSIEKLINACEELGGTVTGQELLSCERAEGLILLVSHDLSLTGAPIALEQFALHLRKTGKQPVFLSSVDGNLREDLRRNAIPVLTVPAQQLVPLMEQWAGLFELVVVNTIVGGAVVSALNGTDTPVLWWIHEAEMIYSQALLQKMPEVLYGNVTVAAVGPRAKRTLLKYRPRYRVEELLYYLPALPGEYTGEAPFPLPESAKGKTVFSLVGTVEERKGQDILADAIRALPPEILRRCFFIFVGQVREKAYYDRIQAVWNEFPDSVRYIPQIEKEKMPSFYRRIDCLICPSRDDPMPVVVTEAFQLSRCVICSRNTGSAHYIKMHDAGILLENDSTEALAGAITRIVQGPQAELSAMAGRGRTVYENYFTEESFAHRLWTIPAPLPDGRVNRKEKKERKETVLVLEQMKKPLRRIPPVMLCWKGLKCFRENGFSYTWRKCLEKMHLRSESRELAKEPYYSDEDLSRQCKTTFPQEVRFSIVVPLYNTPETYLRDMIQSVLDQTYGNWELCLADGSDSSHSDVEEICKRYAEADSRIRYEKLERNLGISGNTNAGLDMATGEYIGLLDHDDILHPAALYEVMRAVCSQNADFIYTDENSFHVTPSDAFCPHFKPDYAPDTLRANNYICHFTVFRKTLLEKTGRFRPECDGSQDYDMVLRLTEQAERIAHIPIILYYWRAHPGSVADDVGAKPYVIEAAHRAVQDHLNRIGLKGEVLDTVVTSMYRIRYAIDGQPLVSIIIPNKDHVADLEKCIRSITEKTAYPNWEIIVVENNSEDQDTFACYERLQKDSRIRIVTWEKGWNYSAINNFGVSFAGGEYYLLLNNDTEVISPEWIEEMLMFAQRGDVGAVGTKLYYPDHTIQHGGVGVGIGGVAAHLHQYFDYRHPGYMGRLVYAQNLSAVTAACIMIPRRVWEQVGGLDEDFAVAFNDIDLCMRIRQAGYLIVWTPFAELYHYESKSRGQDDTPEKKKRFASEVTRFLERWKRELEAGDPYYNPNFSLDRVDFGFVLPRVARERIERKEKQEDRGC